jgi:hypothetical protein
MTARLELANPVERTIAESNRGKRTVRTVRDGFADPDRLLHDLLDSFEADGRQIAPSPGVRAFCRAIQKALEGTGQ